MWPGSPSAHKVAMNISEIIIFSQMCQIDRLRDFRVREVARWLILGIIHYPESLTLPEGPRLIEHKLLRHDHWHEFLVPLSTDGLSLQNMLTWLQIGQNNGTSLRLNQILADSRQTCSQDLHAQLT